MLTPEEFDMLPEPLNTKRQAGGGRSGFIRAAIREKFELEKKQARQKNEVQNERNKKEKPDCSNYLAARSDRQAASTR